MSNEWRPIRARELITPNVDGEIITQLCPLRLKCRDESMGIRN
jgi:hypothetical protein